MTLPERVRLRRDQEQQGDCCATTHRWPSLARPLSRPFGRSRLSALPQLIDEFGCRPGLPGPSFLETPANGLISGAAFILVEIVFGVIIDDEIENRALRKGRGFIQLEPSVFDSCS
jgi:hypothetical protein